TTDDRGRTRTFAIYNLLQDSGHALGSLLAGLPSLEQHGTSAGWNVSLGGYALLLALPVLCYLRLSPAIEPPAVTARPPVSRETRRRIKRLSGLFLIDSLGGGFLLTSLLTYYFTERFGASALQVSALVTAARVLNAGSHLVAAWLARRIGLVNTMVFTHIPSSLLMLTVPI